MSETSLGQDRWFSSNGRWYSPEQRPGAVLSAPQFQAALDVAPTLGERAAVHQATISGLAVIAGADISSADTAPNGRMKRRGPWAVLGVSSTDNHRTWT
jgi:hypothetical protein